MTIIDIPPRDEIDAQLTFTKELIRVANILIDDLPVEAVNMSQNILDAAIEKIEKVEKLLEDQVLTKRKAA
jgi:D-ribose pyranose/furanose isomerase RbsD